MVMSDMVDSLRTRRSRGGRYRSIGWLHDQHRWLRSGECCCDLTTVIAIGVYGLRHRDHRDHRDQQSGRESLRCIEAGEPDPNALLRDDRKELTDYRQRED